MENKNDLLFSKDFYWGSATSAYQVEGMNTNSDWWAWEQEEIKGAHSKVRDLSGNSCDHYSRFREDFDWAKDLGQNAHRLSIEWARIQPSENEWSSEAVEHYKEVIAALRERNIEPFVTALHFTLPQWVADYGGWLNPKIVSSYAKYVEFLIENFGDKVTYWFTLNEPLIAAEMSFLKGTWAPAKNKSVPDFFHALRNMIKAHKTGYGVMKQAAQKKGYSIKVGAAHNLIAFTPYNTKSVFDVFLAAALQKIFIKAYLGFFSVKTDDFIAVNFYFTSRVHLTLLNISAAFVGIKDEGEVLTDVGWTMRPEGLYRVLINLINFKKEIFITENGVADVQDRHRAQFIVEHLKAVNQAIVQGADVRGYFYWSLTDNFEWAYGFAPRFGLLAVDYSTLSRTARHSALVYKRICSSNAIAADLV